ncbi:dolichol-P-glucose synthetase-like protein [Prauserella muralis]|uniref:Dolichol-P-glucose synthetase-like protein n=2 Tax=Prauserella muralis TaxID=588067 RepID=A0A2V4AHW8_9PSEU|nr:dolichol-P-glucose synthetase-like protein [Prauserella muralis]
MWPWLRLLGGVALLAGLGWRLGADAALAGLARLDAVAVLVALGLGVATTVLCAWRWCLVARHLGLALPLGVAIGDYYRSLFLNAVLPGGVLGDAHRAVGHGRRAGDVGRGVSAVVVERTGGQLVLAAVALPALLVQPAPASVLAADLTLVVLALAAVVAVLVVLARARSRDGGVRWRRSLADVLSGVRAGLLAREVWPGVLLLSLAALAGHVTLFVVAARTAGSAAPVSELAPLFVPALLAMALPLNVGGWGPREAFCALAFGAAGLGAAQGLAVAVTYGVLALLASLPGAVVVLLRRDVTEGGDRHGRSPVRPAVGGRVAGRLHRRHQHRPAAAVQ